MSEATVSLHDLAPRLAKARDAWVDWNQQRRAFVIWRCHKILDAERCVAHRELQLVRAMHTGDRRYIVKRERLLAEARKQLARLERMEPPA